MQFTIHNSFLFLDRGGEGKKGYRRVAVSHIKAQEGGCEVGRGGRMEGGEQRWDG